MKVKKEQIQDIIDTLGNAILRDAMKFVRGGQSYNEMCLSLDIHGAVAHKDISALLEALPIEGEKVEKLRDLVRVQSSKGNYDYSEYMRGMANGLIIALSVFDDKEPVFHGASGIAHTPKRELANGNVFVDDGKPQPSSVYATSAPKTGECCERCYKKTTSGIWCIHQYCPCHQREEKEGKAMIPKQAIEKAIEGGWQNRYHDYQWIALDPSFWQALGKALGWRLVHSGHNPKETDCGSEENCPARWQYEAQRFYLLILTGGDTKKFWADLLTQ